MPNPRPLKSLFPLPPTVSRGFAAALLLLLSTVPGGSPAGSPSPSCARRFCRRLPLPSLCPAVLPRLLLFTLSLFHSFPSLAQETEAPDIDQWQVLKDAAAKDPFAHKNQFTINFRHYTEGTDWAYPLPGGKVISPFGGARHHAGTDIKTCPNDTIRAVFPGHVTLSGPHYAYGNTIIIRHANGLETLYSHQSRNLCKKGDWVQAGQPIGLTGRTGRATTEHLHLETRVNGQAFDSAKLFDHPNHTLHPYLFVFTKHGSTVKITQEK